MKRPKRTGTYIQLVECQKARCREGGVSAEFQADGLVKGNEVRKEGISNSFCVYVSRVAASNSLQSHEL